MQAIAKTLFTKTILRFVIFGTVDLFKAIWCQIKGNLIQNQGKQLILNINILTLTANLNLYIRMESL